MAVPGKAVVALIGLLAFSSAVFAQSEGEDEYKVWQETEVKFPAAPQEKNLTPFFVSAATDNRFLVDTSTLTVGADGVVRYVLVVITPQGARNVTFEGMRCETSERRIYALGRRDGEWSLARNSGWGRIKNVDANRHHAALFLEYFCPSGLIVRNAEEAKGALVRGIHSDNIRW